MSVCCQSEDAVHFPGAAERVELYLDNVLVEIRYLSFLCTATNHVDIWNTYFHGILMYTVNSRCYKRKCKYCYNKHINSISNYTRV